MKIQKNILRVKDSMNMFYKNLETMKIFNNNNETISYDKAKKSDSKNFGFKS